MDKTYYKNVYNVGRFEVILVTGDITKLGADCVVNAANKALRRGHGVCGAIYAAAGIEFLEAETNKIPGCSTGRAVMTPGFNLSGSIIHAVGPIFEDGWNGEDILLASTYKESLQLTEETDITSIAFPCISTGVYAYPKRAAAEIAAESIFRYLADLELEKNAPTNLQCVYICCFEDDDFNLYEEQLPELIKRDPWTNGLVSLRGKLQSPDAIHWIPRA